MCSAIPEPSCNVATFKLLCNFLVKIMDLFPNYFLWCAAKVFLLILFCRLDDYFYQSEVKQNTIVFSNIFISAGKVNKIMTIRIRFANQRKLVLTPYKHAVKRCGRVEVMCGIKMSWYATITVRYLDTKSSVLFCSDVYI